MREEEYKEIFNIQRNVQRFVLSRKMNLFLEEYIEM